jgi:predicted amidohydrolase
VEFPQLSRALVAADVDLLFVPSCTESFHGYWRVRHCAAARAVEGQLCAVVSSCVEGDPDYSEIDVHYGQGVILSPCDGTFPKAGLLAEGEAGDDDIVSTTIRLNDLRHLRTAGAVFNQHDVRAAGEITPLLSPV